MISLIPFELKKIFKKKSSFIAIIIAFLILLALSYPSFYNNQVTGSSSDPDYGPAAIAQNRRIAEEHTGYLTDELVNRITNDYAQNIGDFKKRRFYDIFSFDTISHFVPGSSKILQSTYQSDTPLHFDDARLKSPEELGAAHPLSQYKLGNYAPWNQLYEMLNSAFVTVVLLLFFLCAPIFSGESSKKMNQLLLSTRYGRKQLTLAKLASLWIIATLTYTLVTSVILLVFANYYGFSGWDTSVQMNLFWINLTENILAFPESMNLLQTLLYILSLQYACLLFSMGLLGFVSSHTKNSLTTFATSTLLYLIPYFLLNIFPGGIVNKFLILTDMTTLSPANTLLKLSNHQGFFLENFTSNSILLLSFRSAGCLLFASFIYIHLNRKQVTD